MGLLFAAALTVASFTARDVAVIDAALAVAVPDFTHQLLVVNQTAVARAGSRPVPPPLARDLDERNGEHRSIESLKLKRQLSLVDPEAKPEWSRNETRVVLTLPAYSADGNMALVEIGVTRPHEGWLEPIRETILLRRNKGMWALSEHWSESLTVKPPPGVPLRVGGDVKAPVVIERVEPAYPPEAAKARIAGIVIVEAIIDETGRVTDVRVLKPLPFGLSDAAVAAVKQWRFRPGTLNGQPVPVIFNLTVNFRPPAVAP